MTRRIRSVAFFVFLFILVACGGESAKDSCPVTVPSWLKFPEDSAVLDPPAYGYYYVNEDLSIWASARWTDNEDFPLHAGKEGN